MADPTTSLALSFTPLVVSELIKAIKHLLKRTDGTSEEQFRQNLTSVQTSLGLIREVLEEINHSNRTPDGIVPWKEEASNLVSEAKELLGRIENNNKEKKLSLSRIWSQKLHYSKEDARQLNNLKERLDNIFDRYQTVRDLLNNAKQRNFGFEGHSKLDKAIDVVVVTVSFIKDVKGIFRKNRQ